MPPNAFIDDANSIAIDTTNTASETIDSSPSVADLDIIRSIDIQLQYSPYFKLDCITSIVYSSQKRYNNCLAVVHANTNIKD